ncbi:MAG: hypothetical protein AAGA54_04065 [Myxococcota bacterium]
MTPQARASAVLFVPAAAWVLAAAAGLAMTSSQPAAWGPVATRGGTVGSADCARCHAEQHESWHASFHRTMTQSVAAGAEVLAPFDGETLQTAGFVATMDRTPEGQPQVTVRRQADGEVVFDATVELTVGSHRYQQYVARIDRGGGDLDRWRLPFAWHPEAGRWIHLGGAFLFPDLPEGDTDAFFRHFSRWNDNCVFCHNTEPNPGRTAAGTFETQVAEFGIGCEACHAPGEAHVLRQSNPLRRMLGGEGDPSVTHPGELTPQRHAEVCGRCHGQRIGKDVASILANGDGFIPGEDLGAHSRPILAEARLASDPDDARPFAERFWPDGTPRLSAYEYQGLLLSPCYDEGHGMTCGDCHTMHGQTPAMQLRPGARTEAACVGRCHTPSHYAEHGGHDTVTCQGCHMPRTTYGLLRGMISHRITSPDPAALLDRNDQPDACTQCHVDQTRDWAAAKMATLGFAPVAVPSRLRVGSRVERDLLGGDPVQRALAAHALARPEAVGAVERRVQALVDALEDDYPAVRWFAVRGLQAIAEDAGVRAWAEQYAFMADAAERIVVVDELRAAAGESALHATPAVWDALAAQRDDVAIAIGE